MKCPDCDFPLRVNRTEDKGYAVYRFRYCSKCRRGWHTKEVFYTPKKKKPGPNKKGLSAIREDLANKDYGG